MSDDAYEPGSPKRGDYREPVVCVFCGCAAGHYTGCQVAPHQG